MASELPPSSDPNSVLPVPSPSAVYFDGTSSQRRAVTLAFSDRLEINEGQATLARWPYGGIRRTDSPPGVLRVSCLGAPALARLELRDEASAAELVARCPRLDDGHPTGRGIGVIVGWSLAAAASIVAVIWLGIPLVADRLAPLVPPSLERRIGSVAERQVKAVFSGEVCDDPDGMAALAKLVTAMRTAAGLQTAVEATVLSTPLPNALALPGGTVVLFEGMLAKADNPDEIAGVLAHEFGHLQHRDGMRQLIYNGGTSFLVGLLFGDVTGSGAMIFAARTLITASYSRDAEQNADAVSIDLMHRLGRPTKPMGDLLDRVTRQMRGIDVPILSSHPLTEGRLARLTEENRPPSAPPLLTDQQWTALKAVCKNRAKP
jgi:Zn-dependent protease with chaperone function